MNTTPNPTTPNTVVLIHGLWLNARSWEPWVERYEQRGLKVIATSWPEMDGDIAALRTDTSAFDDLGVEAILDHYTQAFPSSRIR
jgi:pimeloyl-ACP methyl ester carboxylesterase